MGLFGNKEVNIQITEQFADSASKLPKEIKAKTLDVPNKLFGNPQAKGLNLEQIKGAIDDVYTIRVDVEYRIVLLCPHNDNGLFIFLYVDREPIANKWAENFRWDINKYGAFQIYSRAPEKTSADKNGISLVAKLDGISDNQFVHLEIPQTYWQSLRTKVYLKSQLNAYKDYISEAAMLALEAVFDGSPVNSVNELYDQLTASPIDAAITPPEPLFQKYSNSDMANVGVPEEYIDTVKSIKFISQLSDLQMKLPKDAVQGLYCLLNGENIESVVKFANTGSEPTAKLIKALENDNSKGITVKASSVDELKNLLEYPMEKWRIFLHPQQRGHAYRHYNGAARILGGAGTGKTVIVVHHAKFLAQECGKNEKILVTTYSHTLKNDIEKRLKMVCSPYELSRIDISTVDKLASNYLKNINGRYSIEYATDFLNSSWNNAIRNSGRPNTYNIDFLKDEWAYVIQAQNIATKEDYLKASRKGRGKQLTAHNREDVWLICEEYRRQIESNKKLDIDYAENLVANSIGHNFSQYKSVIVDECQDLTASAIRMLRATVGKPHQDDLFFSGDTRQSIFNKTKVSLSQCGVTINNRSTMLKLNYRTTAEIYDVAYKIQKKYEYDDLDGSVTEHDKSVCVYHGDEPTIKRFNSDSAEMAAVAQEIRRKISQNFCPEEICVVARFNKTVEKIGILLANEGINVLQLKNNVDDDKSVHAVRIATMHRVKGMEFDCMYVVGVNSGVMPPQRDLNMAEGQEELEEVIKKDANLLSVAITRARKYAWISYSGMPSEYLDDFLHNN